MSIKKITTVNDVNTTTLIEDNSIMAVSGNVISGLGSTAPSSVDSDPNSGGVMQVYGVLANDVSGATMQSVAASTTASTIQGKYGYLSMNEKGVYTYTLRSSLAPGDTNATDIAQYNAVQALTKGQNVQEVFTYYIEDQNGSASDNTATLTINIQGINTVPIVSSQTAAQTGVDGAAVSFSVAGAFSGPAGVPAETFTYSATGLPTGLSINATTGLISGTIANTDSKNGGVYNVAVTANNGHGGTVTETFHWTISDLLPTVTPILPITSNDGAIIAPFSIAGDFKENLSGVTLSFSASGLPTGLSMTSAGVISGTIANSASAHGPFNVVITATDSNGGSITDNFAWTVNDVLPVVTQIPNQTSNDAAVVSLNVASDFKENLSGVTLSYSETGLPTGLSMNSAGVISGTIAHTASAHGPFTVVITATDSNGGHVTDTFTWNVNDVAPVLTNNLTSNQIGIDDLPILPINTASAFTNPLGLDTYSATGLPTGVTINSSTGVISGTLANNASGGGNNGVYAIHVTASDGQGGSATETFNLTTVDVPPFVIKQIPAQSNVDGTAVNLSVSGDFIDILPGVALTYSASNLPAGLTINPTTGVISGTIDITSAITNPIPVTITVSDNQGGTVFSGTASQTFNWTVTDNAPTLVQTPAQSVVDGNAFSINMANAFHDTVVGEHMTYTATGLPSWLSMNSAGVISGIPEITSALPGPYTISVTATDANGVKAPVDTFSLTVTDNAPTLLQTTPQSVVDGNAFSINIANAFHDGVIGEQITYAATGLPAWLSMNSAGVISGTPEITSALPQTFSISVTATDANGVKAPVDTFNLTVNSDNPMVGTETSDPQTNQSQAATVSPLVDEHVTDIVTGAVLSVSNPTILNGALGTVSVNGTQLVYNPGHNYDYLAQGEHVNVSISYTVTNSEGGSVQATDVIQVNGLNDTPTLASIANQSVNALSNLSFTAVGADVDTHNNLSYSLDAASVALGASINASTGVFSWTPNGSNNGADLGSHIMTITVTDTPNQGAALSASQQFIVNVADVAPTVVTTANQSNVDGAVINIPVAFSDPLGLPLTYTVSGLPAGLAFNNGVIAGTLASNDSVTNGGAYNVSITASDGHVGGSVSDTFTFNVANNPPTLNPTSNHNLQTITYTAGGAESLNVASDFTDPLNLPLTYSIASGSLPNGLSLTSGVIAGSISYSDNQAANYSVVVTANDGQNGSISETINFNVAIPLNVSFTSGSPAPTTINGSTGTDLVTFNLGSITGNVTLNESNDTSDTTTFNSGAFAAGGSVTVEGGTGTANELVMSGPLLLTNSALDYSFSLNSGLVNMLGVPASAGGLDPNANVNFNNIQQIEFNGITYNLIVGTTGDDTLNGLSTNSGNDLILAFSGNDTINGSNGNDVVILGDNEGANGNTASVTEGNGNDNIFFGNNAGYGGTVNVTLDSAAGVTDHVTFGNEAGAVDSSGNGGNLTVTDNGSGNDIISFGTGAGDTARAVGIGHATINLSSGNDTISFGDNAGANAGIVNVYDGTSTTSVISGTDTISFANNAGQGGTVNVSLDSASSSVDNISFGNNAGAGTLANGSTNGVDGQVTVTDTGTGSDIITFGTGAGDLSVLGGTAGTGHVTLTLASGNDSVTFSSGAGVAGIIDVTTGSGNNTVTFGDGFDLSNANSFLHGGSGLQNTLVLGLSTSNLGTNDSVLNSQITGFNIIDLSDSAGGGTLDLSAAQVSSMANADTNGNYTLVVDNTSATADNLALLASDGWIDEGTPTTLPSGDTASETTLYQYTSSTGVVDNVYTEGTFNVTGAIPASVTYGTDVGQTALPTSGTITTVAGETATIASAPTGSSYTIDSTAGGNTVIGAAVVGVSLDITGNGSNSVTKIDALASDPIGMTSINTFTATDAHYNNIAPTAWIISDTVGINRGTYTIVLTSPIGPNPSEYDLTNATYYNSYLIDANFSTTGTVLNPDAVLGAAGDLVLGFDDNQTITMGNEQTGHNTAVIVGNGTNSINFGAGAGANSGNEVVKTGTGTDTISFGLHAAYQGGNLSITKAGAGNITFLDQAAAFGGLITINTGASNGVITFGNNAGLDSGDITINGGPGNDTINFGMGAGTNNNTVLYPNASNIIVHGGAGTNTLGLYGGFADYSFSVDSANSSLIDASGVGAGDLGALIKFQNIQYVSFNGSSGNELAVQTGISGTTGISSGIVVGSAGNDTITFGANAGQNGQYLDVVGLNGNDTFNFGLGAGNNSGHVVVDGGGGNNTLELAGAFSDYNISTNNNNASFTVTGVSVANGGNDPTANLTFRNIQNIAFNGVSTAYQIIDEASSTTVPSSTYPEIFALATGPSLVIGGPTAAGGTFDGDNIVLPNGSSGFVQGASSGNNTVILSSTPDQYFFSELASGAISITGDTNTIIENVYNVTMGGVIGGTYNASDTYSVIAINPTNNHNISAHAGNDLIMLNDTNGITFSDTASTSNDLIYIADNATGTVNVGDNNTFVGTYAGANGPLTITTGNGNDFIFLGTHAGDGGNLTITAGSGNDTITFGDYAAQQGTLTIHGGNGNDTIDFGFGAGYAGGNVTITAGSGTNTITFADFVHAAGGNVSISDTSGGILDVNLGNYAGYQGSTGSLLISHASGTTNVTVGEDFNINVGAILGGSGINNELTLGNITQSPTNLGEYLGANDGYFGDNIIMGFNHLVLSDTTDAQTLDLTFTQLLEMTNANVHSQTGISDTHFIVIDAGNNVTINIHAGSGNPIQQEPATVLGNNYTNPIPATEVNSFSGVSSQPNESYNYTQIFNSSSTSVLGIFINSIDTNAHITQ